VTPDRDNLDTDGDLTGDACDSCPNAPDTGLDLDGDGRDNACDDDDDGDGVLDGVDNCPAKKNPTQQDLNGNGVGTACDPLENIKVTGAPLQLAGVIRQRLEQNVIVDIPISADPEFGPWGAGGLGVEVSFDLGKAPVVAAVVDDEGHFVAMAGPASRGTLTFAPEADFCAQPIDGENGAGPLLARSYSLQLLVMKEIPARTRVTVSTQTVPWPGDPR
jgi:hypothetical protein